MVGSVDCETGNCPNLPTLEAMVNLPPENSLAISLRDHISSCAACQKRLDQITDRSSLGSFNSDVHASQSEYDAETLRQLMERIERSLRLQMDHADPPESIDQVATTSMAETASIHQTMTAASEACPTTFPMTLPGSISSPRLSMPTVIGRYSILRPLGRGGTGVVYLAYDPQANRNVAIKVMSVWHRSQQLRLQREAQAIARLQCEEVVKLYSVESAADGQLFLTMEYVPGQTLAERIAHRSRLSIDQIIDIVARVARGVQAAHDAGVVHRDIKPGNILLDKDGRARLADFGMARFSDAEYSLTESGTIVGTLAYLSPEAIAGKTLDARSDVYSLGCVLYETATGVAPFQGTAQQILRQISELDPPLIRQFNENFPVELQAICCKAMSKEPARRYATAAAMADDLHRYQRGLPVVARPSSALERSRMWMRRNRWQSMTMATMALALCGSLIAGVLILHASRSVRHLNTALKQRNAQLASSQREADASFTMTRKQLVSVVDRLKNDLLQIPHAETVAIESIRDAADLFQQLAALRPNDPQVAEEYLQSLKDLWYAEWMYEGDEQEAQALDRFQRESARLLTAFPESVGIAALRAELLLDLAIESGNAGDVDQANRYQQAGQALVEELLARDPGALPVRALAWKEAWQGYQAANQRGAAPQEIVHRARNMVRAQKSVVEATPPEMRTEAICIWVDQLTRLGEALVKNQEPGAAAEAVHEAKAVLEMLDADKTATVEALQAQARILRAKIQIAIAMNNPREEEGSHRQLIALYRQLHAQFPESEVQSKVLAEALCDMADFRKRSGTALHGELEEAADLLDRVENNSTVSAWAAPLREKITRLQNRAP